MLCFLLLLVNQLIFISGNNQALTYSNPLTDTLIATVIEIEPIKKFKTVKLPPGKYTTDGYVIHQYKCPPCPEGADCKPCLGNHVVVSNQRKVFSDYSKMTDYNVIVFVEDPDRLESGKKYIFDIEISEESSMTDQPNHIRLIRAH